MNININEVNMQSDAKIKNQTTETDLIAIQNKMLISLADIISQSWRIIAPSWPLKHLIAANPLQGLESLPFEEALTEGFAYFQDSCLAKNMAEINRETIKWCQAFFDEGQATITMPYRHLGLYQAFQKLVPFDKKLCQSNPELNNWLANLPHSAENAISACLTKLMIPFEHRVIFLSLILTTLPGWASYIKYRTEWAQDDKHDYPVSQADYLAVRLVLTSVLWPQAVNLLTFDQQLNKNVISQKIKHINEMEEAYRKPLLGAISCQAVKMSADNSEKNEKPIAQLVFCIDVRSEPFRRAIEAQGNYETFGFAGFFGIPVRVENEVLGESKVSCPVLLKPKHTVKEVLICSNEHRRKVVNRIKFINTVKSIYQGLKYNFTTPLTLVEVMGLWSGLSMSLRTILPKKITRFKRKIVEHSELIRAFHPSLLENTDRIGIALKDQCAYAESSLRMIGLIAHFSPIVILCGHGSETQNNAYATALDCGACGGNHGGNNAKILAEILNHSDVRHYLIESGIHIPHETTFIAAEHNTTTDEVSLYINQTSDVMLRKRLDQLALDLQAARKINNKYRYEQLGYNTNKNRIKKYISHIKTRSNDWAQTRPEWGLARNASFIVAPRKLTKLINLEGRAFLHSYNWQEDKEGALLTTILTAPMVVAQWINCQYLFSSLDNIAYGSGSKITHNISGKIGIMQGNGSDLMHGLPLQSLFRSDTNRYHEPQRLITIVYAPRTLINKIINVQPVLQKLFGNGWVMLVCIQPDENKIYYLKRDLTWSEI